MMIAMFVHYESETGQYWCLGNIGYLTNMIGMSEDVHGESAPQIIVGSRFDDRRRLKKIIKASAC